MTPGTQSAKYSLSLCMIGVFCAFYPPSLLAQGVPEPLSNAPQSSIDLQAIGGSVGFGLVENARASVLLARFTEIDATYAQVGITNPFNSFILYGGDYILIDPDSGTEQHTLRGHVTARKEWQQFSFDLRGALEYRFAKDDVEERWRGRARMRTTFENFNRPFRYSVYASLEPNYDFSDGSLQQTNYSIGFKPWLSKWANLDLSYIFVDSEQGSDLNLTAVTLNFELD